MTREQLDEEKKRLEAELSANTAQRAKIRGRLNAVETLMEDCEPVPAPPKP